MEHTSIEDPTYHAAVVDLLGVLAYGELTAFIRMAVDSDLAPTLSLKSSMAGLANTEYVQYSVLVEHMRSHDIDPDAAMAPFVVPFASYHERTKPKGWLEGLVKAYVGDGIAKDFYREMSVFVDDDTREVMARALDDAGGVRLRRRGRARHPQDRPHRRRAAGPVGPAAARRGALAGAGRGGRARRDVGAGIVDAPR